MEQFLKLVIISLALSGTLTLSGCGNKGALYIPDAPAEAQASQTTAD